MMILSPSLIQAAVALGLLLIVTDTYVGVTVLSKGEVSDIRQPSINHQSPNNNIPELLFVTRDTKYFGHPSYISPTDHSMPRCTSNSFIDTHLLFCEPFPLDKYCPVPYTVESCIGSTGLFERRSSADLNSNRPVTVHWTDCFRPEVSTLFPLTLADTHQNGSDTSVLMNHNSSLNSVNSGVYSSLVFPRGSVDGSVSFAVSKEAIVRAHFGSGWEVQHTTTGGSIAFNYQLSYSTPRKCIRDVKWASRVFSDFKQTNVMPTALIFLQRQGHRHDLAVELRKNRNKNILVLELGVSKFYKLNPVNDSINAGSGISIPDLRNRMRGSWLVVSIVDLWQAASSCCYRCRSPTIFVVRHSGRPQKPGNSFAKSNNIPCHQMSADQNSSQESTKKRNEMQLPHITVVRTPLQHNITRVQVTRRKGPTSRSKLLHSDPNAFMSLLRSWFRSALYFASLDNIYYEFLNPASRNEHTITEYFTFDYDSEDAPDGNALSGITIKNVNNIHGGITSIRRYLQGSKDKRGSGVASVSDASAPFSANEESSTDYIRERVNHIESICKSDTTSVHNTAVESVTQEILHQLPPLPDSKVMPVDIMSSFYSSGSLTSKKKNVTSGAFGYFFFKELANKFIFLPCDESEVEPIVRHGGLQAACSTRTAGNEKVLNEFLGELIDKFWEKVSIGLKLHGLEALSSGGPAIETRKCMISMLGGFELPDSQKQTYPAETCRERFDKSFRHDYSYVSSDVLRNRCPLSEDTLSHTELMRLRFAPIIADNNAQSPANDVKLTYATHQSHRLYSYVPHFVISSFSQKENNTEYTEKTIISSLGSGYPIDIRSLFFGALYDPFALSRIPLVFIQYILVPLFNRVMGVLPTWPTSMLAEVCLTRRNPKPLSSGSSNNNITHDGDLPISKNEERRVDEGERLPALTFDEIEYCSYYIADWLVTFGGFFSPIRQMTIVPVIVGMLVVVLSFMCFISDIVY